MLPHLSVKPDYEKIEPKIRELVRSLNELGIQTYSSCEGHNAAMHYIPHVMFDVRSFDQDGFNKLVLAVGMLNESLGDNEWTFFPNSLIGNGKPFLTLAPTQSVSSNLEVLERRWNEIEQLIVLIKKLEKYEFEPAFA